MPRPEEIFKALSDPTRLRLLHLLLTSEQTLCVCEMMGALELPQYQVSRHLKVLKGAGLVTSARRGTWMYYSLAVDRSENGRLFAFLREYLTAFSQDVPFEADRKRLVKQLALREEGTCAVGSTL